MELDEKKTDKSAMCMRNHYRKRDELYTPEKLVKIILPYLKLWAEKNKADPVIWCPFDTEDSEFVRVLTKENYKVVYSHINTDQNFFDYEPDQWDIAISNPPFSLKMDIFKRLFNFNKPFVMLCNEMIINYQNVANLFINYEIQLLAPDKKISFDGNTSSFATGYFCWKFLPRDLIFCHMEDNNTNKNFVPAKLFRAEKEK